MQRSVAAQGMNGDDAKRFVSGTWNGLRDPESGSNVPPEWIDGYLWISDATLLAAIAASPTVSGAFIKALSQQLQEALDRLIVFRNMPAPKRLAQNLLALAEGKQAPVKLGIRQQELAELVGVSRMTIASALAQLEELGLVTRHYRHLVITNPVALRQWMKN